MVGVASRTGIVLTTPQRNACGRCLLWSLPVSRIILLVGATASAVVRRIWAISSSVVSPARMTTMSARGRSPAGHRIVCQTAQVRNSVEVLAGPRGTVAPNDPGPRPHVWPFGLVTAGFGVVALLSAVRVALPSWARPAAHMVNHFGRLHGVLFAIGLLVVAHGLLRRRKAAYWIALVLAACGVLAAGRSVLAILLVVGGVTLALRHSAFPAVPNPARVRGAATVAFSTLAFGGIYDAAVHGHQELPVDIGSLDPKSVV